MVPVWILFFLHPVHTPAWVGVLVLGLVLALGLVIFFAWLGTLLERGAKALPACWLFDGPAGPPVKPQRVTKDDGPSPSQYHSIDGWNEAYKAWQAGKPIPFNAHNVSWRYGDDTY